MIVGIGTDIVEIERIRGASEKWGKRFLRKIFTEREIAYCYKKKDPFTHLAVRFAAKEAVVKALSSLLVKRYALQDIEILNHHTGKPFINLLGNLKESFQDKFIIHLTLTHERNYAVATVVLETKNS